MNLDFVRQLRFEPIIQRYDGRDSALYALSLAVLAQEPGMRINWQRILHGEQSFTLYRWPAKRHALARNRTRSATLVNEA